MAYHRKQLSNLPPATWLGAHTDRWRDAYFDPRIKYILEDEYEMILRWAIGDGWRYTALEYWPRHIRERTGIDVRDNEDIDVGLSKMREGWEQRGKRSFRPMEALAKKALGLQ